MGNYNQFKQDKVTGNIGEEILFDALKSKLIQFCDVRNRKKDLSWLSWTTTHLASIPWEDGERIQQDLQQMGADIIQIEEQYKKGNADTGWACQRTGKKRIIFHEIKTSSGTFGDYTALKFTNGRISALTVIEPIASPQRHLITAGSGNIIVELFDNRVPGNKCTLDLYKKLLEMPEPHKDPQAGWYWRYKNVAETITTNDENVEFQNMIWWCLPVNDGTPIGEISEFKRDHVVIVGMTVRAMVKRVEKEILSGNVEWLKGGDKNIP